MKYELLDISACYGSHKTNDNKTRKKIIIFNKQICSFILIYSTGKKRALLLKKKNLNYN